MPDSVSHRATVVVRLPEGMHLRPLTQVARLAQSFACEIRLSNARSIADAKRPFELMTLAAACGESLELEASGPDSQAAVAAIERLFKNDFDDARD